MFKKTAIGSIATLCLCGASAYAEVEPGSYVGASMGKAQIAADELNFDEGDTGFKVFVGYTFNQYAALELSYIDSGTPTLEGNGATLEVEGTAVVAATLVGIPVGNMFNCFGKVGFAFFDGEATARSTTQSAYAEDTSINLAFGLGASVTFWQRFEVRAEYEKVLIEDGDFTMMSLGGAYRF